MDIQQAARELKQPHVQEALKVAFGSADRRIFDLFTTSEATDPAQVMYYRQLYGALQVLQQAIYAVINRGEKMDDAIPFKRPR